MVDLTPPFQVVIRKNCAWRKIRGISRLLYEFEADRELKSVRFFPPTRTSLILNQEEYL